MSVSRGKFLRSLGSSVTGWTLGTGATVAQGFLDRLASLDQPVPPKPVMVAKPGEPEELAFIERGPAQGNRIALTFDDGPDPEVTELIQRELQQRQLDATFFMIGEKVVANLDIARRLIGDGHEIGNHSYTHPKLAALPDHLVLEELQKTQDTLQELLHYRATLFRPPYGAFRKNQLSLAKELGLRTVLWSVDSQDWAQPGEARIAENILSQTGSGSIIVCHDIQRQTARCLGRILDELIARDWRCVTVSALLHHL